MSYREKMPDGTVRLTGGTNPDLAPPESGAAEPVIFTINTPSKTWNCPHGLGTMTPDVTVYINNEIVIAGYTAQDPNNGIVTFYYPEAGKVRLSE